MRPRMQGWPISLPMSRASLLHAYRGGVSAEAVVTALVLASPQTSASAPKISGTTFGGERRARFWRVPGSVARGTVVPLPSCSRRHDRSQSHPMAPRSNAQEGRRTRVRALPGIEQLIVDRDRTVSRGQGSRKLKAWQQQELSMPSRARRVVVRRSGCGSAMGRSTLGRRVDRGRGAGGDVRGWRGRAAAGRGCRSR